MDSSGLGLRYPAVVIEQLAAVLEGQQPLSSTAGRRVGEKSFSLEAMNETTDVSEIHQLLQKFSRKKASLDETSKVVTGVTDKTAKDDLNVIVSTTASAVIENCDIQRNLPIQNLTRQKNKNQSFLGGSLSYTAWNVDVDLGPPVSNNVAVPPEDKLINHSYNVLQSTLFETCCPETQVRAARNFEKNISSNDRVTIAVLTDRPDCTGLLLEGGRRCPGDILLVMSMSWVTKLKSPLKNGLYSLFIHKAISFEPGGRSFIESFVTPRRVTYLVNLFTRGATGGLRDDGDELEIDLDCPLCSSQTLSYMVDDKLFMRIMMAELSIPFPETLAFTYCTDLPYDIDRSDLNFVSLDTKIGLENLILDEIQKFLELPFMQKHEKVVVKPCGVLWKDAYGITFHQRCNITAVWKAALGLLADLEEGDLILIEAFYQSGHQRRIGAVKWSATSEHSNRICATVCRGTDNVPLVTSIVGYVGLIKSPVCSHDSLAQSLDSTFSAFGIDSALQKEVRCKIQQNSEDIFRRFMEYESRMTQIERGGVGSQTDIITVNFILSNNGAGDTVTPIMIDTHSYQRAVKNLISEFVDTDTAGCAFGPLLEHMIKRSQGFVMHGKSVLVIGAGGHSKKFVWESAKDYGIEVILVDPDPSHFAAPSVSQYIVYDLTDHTQDDIHARNIVQLLNDRNITVDGCVAFWEDCGPLAALMCELLNCNGPSYRAALTAKKKSATIQVLASMTSHVPHFPKSSSYASRVYQLSSRADVEVASTLVPFPCVLKLEYGSSAVGVSLVHNIAECYQEWTAVQENLRGEDSYPGVGLGHGNNMLLMDYISGTEHDVDVIIYRRRLLCAFVTDNGPTRLPRFTETAAAMPSFLPLDKQRQLIVAAYKCCLDTGLVSGVFNVELKMTATGPRLIEINARMAGFYVRDWIKTVYSIDILFCAFAIACDVCPILPDCLNPAGHLVGLMLVPSAHRQSLSNPTTHRVLKLLEENGFIRINYIEPSLSPPSCDCDRYEEPYASVAVMDQDADSALTKVAAVFDLLGLNTEQYPVEEFLSDFRKC